MHQLTLQRPTNLECAQHILETSVEEDLEPENDAAMAEIGEGSEPTPGALGYKSKVVKQSLHQEVQVENVVAQCVLKGAIPP